MKEPFVIGIDVGGTNIKYALVNSLGKISFFGQLATRGSVGYKKVLDQVGEIINDLKRKETYILGVGIALPGSINTREGICYFSPNLNWKNVQVVDYLKIYTNLPIKIINDAAAACLGEAYYGAGRGCRNLINITIGTGIGTAFLVNGQSLSGGEGGHMVIEPQGPSCNCGRKGCWEVFCSAPALVAQVKAKISEGYISLLNPQNINFSTISEAWLQNDSLVQECLEQFKYYLAIGIANLVNLFNPEKIIIGGGVVESKINIFTGVEEQVKSICYPSLGEGLSICIAQLKNKAGLIGAASLFYPHSNSR